MECSVEWYANAGASNSGNTYKLRLLWAGLIRGEHQNQKLNRYAAERHSSRGGGKVFDLEGNCIPPISTDCLILELALSLQWKNIKSTYISNHTIAIQTHICTSCVTGYNRSGCSHHLRAIWIVHWCNRTWLINSFENVTFQIQLATSLSTSWKIYVLLKMSWK